VPEVVDPKLPLEALLRSSHRAEPRSPAAAARRRRWRSRGQCGPVQRKGRVGLTAVVSRVGIAITPALLTSTSRGRYARKGIKDAAGSLPAAEGACRSKDSL